ncbi:MAG TPA: ChbG/HpnK family deacetylase [Candidatus Angelobacter sp.]|nr:ChbG/HpnK family deacetylase [Candidatus Angelobacter sp.]
MRRLIVNADDFGLTLGVNRAIAQANREGIVTSATVMANSHGFQEAVEVAKSQPELKTGCHVVLIDGEPLTTGAATLTNNSARFRGNLKEFASAAVRKKISSDEIQHEAEAQICKLQAAGLTVTHVDSHKHTHMFPHVLRPVLRAARRCGVRAVRNPFERWRCWPKSVVFGNAAMWLRAAGVGCFAVFAAAFQRAIRDENMLTTDGTVGIVATGKLDARLLLSMLESLPEGTWELVCHPGYADAELQAAGTRLVQSREVELQALISLEVRNLITRRGIELISYSDLCS